MKEPHTLRVPVPGTPHVMVVCGDCDCVDGQVLPEGGKTVRFENQRDAYLAFLYYYMRHEECRYWAVHWGDAHVIAVKDRRPDE